ncbi:unnamed protein product, partial [Bubo scandiacus]
AQTWQQMLPDLLVAGQMVPSNGGQKQSHPRASKTHLQTGETTQVLGYPLRTYARSSLRGLHMSQVFPSGFGPSSWEGPADVTAGHSQRYSPVKLKLLHPWAVVTVKP